MEEVKKNRWEHDTHIKFTDEGETFEDVVIHGVQGEPDYQITLDDIRECIGGMDKKYHGVTGDTEYDVAMVLALSAEGQQRGESIKINMLDMIPIVHKWIEPKTLKYLQNKMEKKYFTEQEQKNMKKYLEEIGAEDGIQ